jgi:hypothetical protein
MLVVRYRYVLPPLLFNKRSITRSLIPTTSTVARKAGQSSDRIRRSIMALSNFSGNNILQCRLPLISNLGWRFRVRRHALLGTVHYLVVVNRSFVPHWRPRFASNRAGTVDYLLQHGTFPLFWRVISTSGVSQEHGGSYACMIQFNCNLTK